MSELLTEFMELIASGSWPVMVVAIIAAFIGASGAFVSNFRESILCYTKAPRLQIINRLLTVVAVILSLFAYFPHNNSPLTDFFVTILIFIGIWFAVFLVLRIIIGTVQWVLASWK